MASEFRKPQSANEAILQNMLGADNKLREPESVVEELLQEILEQGGGGTNVVANPEMSGTEANLEGLEVGDTKYKVPQGTNVVANPTLAGTEGNLTGIQIGDTKYAIPEGAEIIDATLGSLPTGKDFSYIESIIDTKLVYVKYKYLNRIFIFRLYRRNGYSNFWGSIVYTYSGANYVPYVDIFGINITSDGSISPQQASFKTKAYLHIIRFYDPNSNWVMMCKILSDQTSPYSSNSFGRYLYEQGFISDKFMYPAYGANSTLPIIGAIGTQVSSSVYSPSFYKINTSSANGWSQEGVGGLTFQDKVIQII